MDSRALFRSFGTLAARTFTACALVATASWSTSQECTQAQVKPGRIVGEARFQNAQLIHPYLDANPAVDAYYSMPVAARMGWSYVAHTGYTPRNTWDQNDRVAAAFDLAPDVGLADTFDLSIFDLRLQDGALYAFGSRNPGTTLTHSCSGVRPVSEEPDGRRCDLSEAVVLLNVPVRLQGPAVGRLDATQPVWCSAEAWIQDAPFSGYSWRQAASPSRQFSLTDLTGPGATIPLLVRSVAQITLGVSCSAAVATGSGAAGQPCFVISPPGSGRASLSAAVPFDPGTAPPPFVIPVQCTAGAVRGALDMVGHEIVASQVWLGRNSAEAPFQQMEPRPTGGIPRFDWRFDGFPQGSHAARAWAVLDGRTAFLRLPAKDGLYGRVAVVAQQTTDLGNTFVTRPVPATGQVLLSDLGSGSLASLSLGPLATQHWAPWESVYNTDPDRGDEEPHAFMEAKGALRVTSTSSSGLEGLARAELKGGYDPTTGQTHLEYTLQLGGLSPMNGVSDGSGALPTPWDVSRLHLRFGDPEGGAFEGLAVGLVGGDLALPAVGPASPPLTIPTQRACVARARLQLRIPPAIGAIARPAAEIRSVGPHYGAAESSPLADTSGHYNPDWYDASPPGPEAAIPLELPAGFYYQVTPSVEVTLTGTAGAATRAYLPSLSLPGNAPLRCGDDHGPCLRLGCGGTSYEAVSVEVLAVDGVSPAPVCLSGTSAAFNVRATDTAGLAPSRVSYALDPPGEGCGPNPTNLCNGDCLANPTFTVTVTGLTLGTHRLVACAAPGLEGAQGDPDGPSDGATCYQSAAFQVKTVVCPSDFRVSLDPGEADVAASDPRAAPNLVVSSASDCSASVPVTDDRPVRFPPGTTTVHFAAGQPGSCSTRVTVVPSALALGQGHAGRVRLFEPLTATSPLRSEILVGSGPFDYRLQDHDSAALAREGKIAVTSFPAPGQPPATPSWSPVGLPTGPWRFARHPTKPFLAVLGRTAPATGSGVGPWAVRILQGTQTLSTVTVPLAGPGLRFDLTALGWSPDGRKLAVAGVVRSTGGPTTTSRYVVHVWDTSSVSTPVGPTSTVASGAQGAVVHEILLRAHDLLVATRNGLFRLDPDWHLVFHRRNYDMAIGPGGDSVVLAAVEPDGRARLVYRVLAGIGETREGPVVPPSKYGGNEVAFSADGRFAAITTDTSGGARKAVPVYRLDGLTATSSAVALVTAEADGTDPQFRR